MSDVVRVLVVEDEELPAAAHVEYVRRMPGFELAGDCRTASAALSLLTAPGRRSDIDLMLLDLNLPDMHGLELCRRLHAADCPVDIIAVTAARDLTVVQGAMTAGIVQYLIKPFTFPIFREKLTSYAEYRASLPDVGTLTQSEVDRALAKLRSPGGQTLDKGMAQETLDVIIDALRTRSPAPSSAAEMAELVGCSRVTARRYLESLADHGRVAKSQRLGRAGRPEVEYAWNEPVQ